MHRRDLASLVALGSLALTIGVGCPEDKPKTDIKPTAPATTATAAGTDKAADRAAKKEEKKEEKAAAGGDGKMGTATLHGVVSFTGKAPDMKVPKKRKDAEFCKTKEIKYNAVVTAGGKLQDVFVRLSNDSVKGDYKAPTKHAEIDQTDCMYSPRIQGVVAGETIDIKNGDATLHNVHTYKGAESWFNKPQIKGSDPIAQELPDEPKIIKFTCDVHPWMRGFVVVTSHPFFAVSAADGSFTINKVPAGDFTIEAWHPHYGLKTAKVHADDGKTSEVTFSYDGTEAEPAENKDELKDLF
jgi:plastocyanin